MMLAWLSSSEMMASSSPSSVSNSPPLASKQDEYRIVSSVPRNSLSFASSCLCSDCVPQMNRTDHGDKSGRALVRASAPVVLKRWKPETLYGHEVQQRLRLAA